MRSGRRGRSNEDIAESTAGLCAPAIGARARRAPGLSRSNRTDRPTCHSRPPPPRPATLRGRVGASYAVRPSTRLSPSLRWYRAGSHRSISAHAALAEPIGPGADPRPAENIFSVHEWPPQTLIR